jgi:hypothetical protein
MKSDSFDTPDRRADDGFDPTEPGGPTDPRGGAEGAAAGGAYRAGGQAAEGDDPAGVDLVQECLDPDVQHRLWLKAIVPLLQLRSHETDPSSRVQFAFDLMYIAACERIARILRTDLSSDSE